MARGVNICGVITKTCKLMVVDSKNFKIILTQGLNKQIRRMCKNFGYNVERLERIRIVNIDIKGLGLGKWRDLTEDELIELRKL
jgi:23S rRNA pseudouridine2604 synthase